MSQPEYPITLQTVRDYLATLGPDEEAGIALDSFECPVARAARLQYGTDFCVAETYYHAAGELAEGTPPEIEALVRAIDRSKNLVEQPITRAEVEALLPKGETEA